MPGRSMGEDPFATPAHLKTPIRQLRGRTVAPVSIWTSGDLAAPAGLTVSSMLIAEGEPSLVIGLLADTSNLWDAIQTSGTFVVHLLPRDHNLLADIFAGVRPSPGGPFAELEVSESDHGPVIAKVIDRIYCRLEDSADCGFQKLLRARIENMELSELDDPLAYFRGRYRGLAPD